MDNKFIKIFSLLLFFILLSGCSRKSFKEESELLEYLKDESNGFFQAKSVNGIEFTLVNRPIDLIVFKEIGKSKNPIIIDSIRRKYQNYFYLNLNINNNGLELLNSIPKDKIEFSNLVNQLSFGMKESLVLYSQSKDTIELSDFISPRTFGMGKSTGFLLAYPRNNKMLKDEYLVLTIRDLGLNTGEVKFKIDTKTIKDEPTLF